ncbi:MAG: hypothetical protein ACYDDF_13815 [Thermoplasmatota archaeon]
MQGWVAAAVRVLSLFTALVIASGAVSEAAAQTATSTPPSGSSSSTCTTNCSPPPCYSNCTPPPCSMDCGTGGSTGTCSSYCYEPNGTGGSGGYPAQPPPSCPLYPPNQPPYGTCAPPWMVNIQFVAANPDTLRIDNGSLTYFENGPNPRPAGNDSLVRLNGVTWIPTFVAGAACPCASTTRFDLHQVGFWDGLLGQPVGAYVVQNSTGGHVALSSGASNSIFSLNADRAGGYTIILEFQQPPQSSSGPNSGYYGCNPTPTASCYPPQGQGYPGYSTQPCGSYGSNATGSSPNGGCGPSYPFDLNGGSGSPPQGGPATNGSGCGGSDGASCPPPNCPTVPPQVMNGSAQDRYNWYTSNCSPPQGCPSFPPYYNGTYEQQKAASENWSQSHCTAPPESQSGMGYNAPMPVMCRSPAPQDAATWNASQRYAWASANCSAPACTSFPPPEWVQWTGMERGTWVSDNCHAMGGSSCMPPEPQPTWPEASMRAWMHQLFSCLHPPSCLGQAPNGGANMSFDDFKTFWTQQCGAPRCDEPMPFWVAAYFFAPSLAKDGCMAACGHFYPPPANWSADWGRWAPCLSHLAGNLTHGLGNGTSSNATNKSGKIVVPGFEGAFALLAFVGAAAIVAMRRR